MGAAASLGAELEHAWSWSPGIALGLSSYLHERVIRKPSLVLGPGGFGEAGDLETLSRTEAPCKPHLHVVHHHLIGKVAAVLGLIHLLVKEGLGGEGERMRLQQCGREISEHPPPERGSDRTSCAGPGVSLGAPAHPTSV